MKEDELVDRRCNTAQELILSREQLVEDDRPSLRT
jgi:hypothetical protein